MASEIRSRRLAALSAAVIWALGGAGATATAGSAEPAPEQGAAEPAQPEPAPLPEVQAQSAGALFVPRSVTLLEAMERGEVLVVRIASVAQAQSCEVPGDLTIPVSDLAFDVLAVVKQITPESSLSGPAPKNLSRTKETPSAALAPGLPISELPWNTVCVPPRRHAKVLIAGGYVGRGASRQLWVPAGYPYFFPGQVLLVAVTPYDLDMRGSLSFVRESLAFEVAPDGGLFRASDGRAVLGVRPRPRVDPADPSIALGAPALPSAASFVAAGGPAARRRRYPARGKADDAATVIHALQKAFTDGGGQLAQDLCPGFFSGDAAARSEPARDLLVSTSSASAPRSGPVLLPLPWSAEPVPEPGLRAHTGVVLTTRPGPCSNWQLLDAFATGALRWEKYPAPQGRRP